MRASLITQKICQNKLNFSEEVCGNLTHLEEIQQEVQRHVTDYEALFNIISVLPRWYCVAWHKSLIYLSLSISISRLVFALVAGTWSDQHGRKGLLLLTVLGNLLSSLSYCLNYIFLKQLDWRFLFLELVYDFCGGSITYYMMEYSYIVDITQVGTITANAPRQIRTSILSLDKDFLF